MHIIIGFLGLAVTVLVALGRLADAGIDLGGLNPFLWGRRRKQYDGDPLFKIEQPLDATPILAVAITKADGDMTRDDKRDLLNVFEHEFHLPKKEAAGLLISSAHVLGDGVRLREQPHKFLQPSLPHFTSEQAQSARRLLTRIAGNKARHPNVEALIATVEQAFDQSASEQQCTW